MSNSPPAPPKTAWISRVWTIAQPVLVRESIVILQSVIKGGEILLSRLETRSGQLQLPAPSPESSYLLKAQPWFQTLGAKWWQLMAWLRGKLPSAWQGKLTETGLTAIFIGILLIFLWPGPSQSPATPPPPKTRPTPILAPPPAQTTVLVKPRPAPNALPPVELAPEQTPSETPPTEIIEPEPPPETNLIGTAPPTISDQPDLETPVEPTLTPAPAEAIPPGGAAIEVPEPVIAVEDAPIVPQLSPAEAALADAQNQLLGISDRYRHGLVADLVLDQTTGAARLTFNPAWYDLSPSAQDGLAQELWQRSHELEFAKLLITDTAGQVLVRPPIIGQKPVIVHRVATVP
ncbi:hypothetical protein RIF25_01255 [Thermosynechococcaceae cyanobacterium BACA0444]|uniref:Uncharacterized protein n=1 Tax=Pseudocalidococcus azoricus BACA0444 TaxID=2918990 RepID=A0AAE4JWY8_9CYAN|nr:hypothetical protein [Pseudocalidococcus azoricus]MDS3859424.1 hypothetical protein [Pseudocalidococcus azoricus BACA0444]